MLITPSETLISVFPSDLIEMIDSYNKRNYERNLTNSGRNDKLKLDLMKKHRNKLLEVFEREKENAIKYEINIMEKYSLEQEQISILNIKSYLLNKENGFGRFNDEKLFEFEKQNNKLYEEVIKWLENTENYRFLKRIIISYKILQPRSPKTKK